MVTEMFSFVEIFYPDKKKTVATINSDDFSASPHHCHIIAAIQCHSAELSILIVSLCADRFRN